MVGFVICASVLLASQQPVEAKLPKTEITIAIRATPIEKALVEIGKAVNRQFDADKALEKEVVAIRVSKVRADELLNRAADLLLAKWELKDGVLTLVPDEGKEKAAREKTALVQLRYARSILDRARKEASELPKWSTGLANDTLEGAIAYQKTKLLNDPEDAEQLLELTRNIPGTRATIRAMALLTPEQIALAFKGRTVLADKPTQFQYQLPPQISQIVNTCIEEQNAYADVADAKLGLPDPKKQWETRRMHPANHGYSASTEPFMRINRASGARGKTLLCLKRLYFGLQARLMVAGPTGEFMIQGYVCYPNPETVSASASDPRKIPISNESAELCRTLKFPTKDRPEMPGALKMKVLDPEGYDPLSFGATDVVFGLPRSKESNVIALIPDDFFEVVQNLGAYGEVNALTLESKCQTRQIAEWVESDGWLTFQPFNIVNTRLLRLDRPSYSEFLKHLVIERKWTFDQLLALRRKNVYLGTGGIYGLVLNCFEPCHRQILARNDENALQILAMLPTSQYLDLANGRKINLNLIPPALQTTILRRLLSLDRVESGTQMVGLKTYDDDFDQAESDVIWTNLRNNQPMVASHISLISGGMGYLSDETTEMLATGLPSGACLSLLSKRQPTVFCKTEIGNVFLEWREKTCEQIASSTVYARKTSQPMWEPKLFQVGWKAPKYLVLEVLPSWTEPFGLYEDSYNGRIPFVPFGQLPLDMQKTIDGFIKKYKDMNAVTTSSTGASN